MEKARFIVLATLLGFLSISANTSMAQSRPFGLGAILGSPTGVSFKYWHNQRNAFSGAAAWSIGRNDALQLNAEYLWHRYDLFDETDAFLYYGVGGRILLGDNASGLGIRFPFGISHFFEDRTFDVFFQLVPVFNLAPATSFDMQGGVGGRYYFRRSRN